MTKILIFDKIGKIRDLRQNFCEICTFWWRKQHFWWQNPIEPNYNM